MRNQLFRCQYIGWMFAITLCLFSCEKEATTNNITEEENATAEYNKIVKLLPSKVWVTKGSITRTNVLFISEPKYSLGWHCELNNKGKITKSRFFTYEIMKNPFRLLATDEDSCQFIIGGQGGGLTSNSTVLSCQAQGSEDYMSGIYSSQEWTKEFDSLYVYNLHSGKIGDIRWVFHPEGSSLHGEGELRLYGSGDLIIEHGNGNKPREYAAPWWSFHFGSVRIDPHITSIGLNAFKNNGVDYFHIEYGADQLQSIGDYAFYGNTLSDLNIPKSLRDVGNYAFYSEAEKEKGSSLSFLFSNVEKIGDYAFYNNMMNNAKAKAEGKYYSLSLPDNCKEIGTHAFKGYINKITINENLTKLSESAFVVTGDGGDMYFKHKTMEVKEPIVVDEKGNNVQGNWTLHIPKGTLDYFTNTYPWNTFGKIVDDQSSIYSNP